MAEVSAGGARAVQAGLVPNGVYSIFHGTLDPDSEHPLCPNRGEYLTRGENCRSSFGEDAMRQLIVFQKS